MAQELRSVDLSVMCAVGLAAEVGKVFVVSKTSASVVKAAQAEPHKFVVAKSGD